MPVLTTSSGSKLAVGGLVLLNVVLIGALALRTSSENSSAVPTPASVSSSTPLEGPTSTPRRSAGPSTSPTPTPPTSEAPSPPGDDDSGSPSPGAREPAGSAALLAVNSERLAWRAEGGSCGTRASLEVSDDGGRSWRTTNPEVSSVVRLKSYGPTSVFVVGADDRCRPTYAWISGPGGTWQRDATRAEDVWYRTPDDLDLVHAPGGGTSRPCGSGLVDLAGLGTYQAAALCEDGRLRTNDEDRGWRTVRTNSGGLSVNADDNSFVVALRQSGCSGVVVQTFDADGRGLEDQAGSCRLLNKPPAGGQVAVAHRDDSVWLWTGERVSVY